MQKVRKRLMEEKEMRQRQETIRRIREEKKYATSVQREVLANRQSEKKKLAEAVKKHRKGMKTQLEAMLHNAEQMLKDEEVEETRGPKKHIGAARAQTARKMSRSTRDKKFGYGGQKKRSKRNDKESFGAFDAGKKGKRGGKRR
uniref:rRNA-processing protein EBP2 n=1 Tax=Steinernema glaseri TaxID=37863 RepID=A0A1I7YAU7_9BILA